MKKTILLLFVIAGLLSCKKNTDECGFSQNPKADSLQKILKKYTLHGVPGAVITIKDANGFWTGAEGFAKPEHKSGMTPDRLQYGFSITKMITAIAVMQLKEQNKIDINRPVIDYLPAELHSLVPDIKEVTVKMLLNHTSGYNDYIRTDEFAERWLQNPLKIWTKGEYYDLIKRNVTSTFKPGTDFLYSNTNYYLLSLIIDHVAGIPHGNWFQKNILDKLSLKQTYYKHSPGYPVYNQLPDTYWPRIEDGILENNTQAQQNWMKSEEYGATGIIASPKDYIRLLEGLVNGDMVNAASFTEMKQWVQASSSQEPDYGLGLCYWGYKGKHQFGHDGDGIGAMITLIYFPDSKTYLLAAANASVEFGGGIAELLHGFRNEVADYLAGF